MQSLSLLRLLLLLALACGPVLGRPAALGAQDPPSPPAQAPVVPDDELAKARAALAKLESDAEVGDEVKALLRPKYEKAIKALEDAAAHRRTADQVRETARTGPEAAAAARSKRAALPSPEQAAQVAVPADIEALRQEISRRRGELDAQREQLREAAAAVNAVKGRPVVISQRLPQAQRELADAEAQLASFGDDSSPSRTADGLVLQATRLRLQMEVEMLKAEQQSQAVREDLRTVEHELLAREVENAEAALTALEGELRDRLETEADRFRARVDEAKAALTDGAMTKLVSEVDGLVDEFSATVNHLRDAATARKDVTSQLERLEREYDGLKLQLESGGHGAAMIEVLFEIRRTVMQNRYSGFDLDLPGLEETHLARLDVKRQLSRLEDVRQQHAGDPRADALVEVRSELLHALRSQYGLLIQELSVIEADKATYLDRAQTIDNDIKRRLFWMKSSPPVSASSLLDLTKDFTFVLRTERWQALGQNVLHSLTRRPVASALWLLTVVVLLFSRRRLAAALKETGEGMRRISTDRYAYTVRALYLTGLLAAPLSLLLLYGWWAFSGGPVFNELTRDSATAMWMAARLAFFAGVVIEICRPDGLGQVHFRWPPALLPPIRRSMRAFAWIYIPMTLLVVCHHPYGHVLTYLDGLGRSAFIAAHVAIAVVLRRALRGPRGLLAAWGDVQDDHRALQYRNLWVPLIVLTPLGLVVMAAMGYFIAAVEISLALVVMFVIAFGGVLLYSLLNRWFRIRYRRLALADARQRAQTQREAPASGEHVAEVIQVDEEVDKLDLSAIGYQTSALLKLASAAAVVVVVVLLWERTIPLIDILNAVRIGETLTLLRLIKAALVVVVTYVAVHNLPGLLELAGMRESMAASTRYAVSRLCQYGLIAVGVVMFFNAVNMDWSKFGWVVAALSVGIGFGLQEVVANFVCGLILLFEQPLRVGDIVTIEGTTGTVTRIQMRATTITNWDRQELLVPNKTLITSTLLNWTLTAPLNRVVIRVGVAYGSDVDLARAILVEVAHDHPRVLDDPPPLATFEEFADSSLSLVLRAFLPNLDERLQVITELHTAINDRFAAAGIEIAFPQLDVNRGAGWPDGGAEPPATAPS